MTDPRSSDHDAVLARFEQALSTGSAIDAMATAHISACAACRVVAAELGATAASLRMAASKLLLDPSPSDALRERVRSRLAGDAPPAPPQTATPAQQPSRWWPRLRWAAAGAAFAVLAVVTTATILPAASVVDTFSLTGTALAPAVRGEVDLRPLPGGSVQMTMEVEGVAASRPGEFYELWWVGPEKRHVSCGTFRSDGGPLTLAFVSGVDVSTTVLVEITLEADDGDAAPGPHIAQ